VRGTNTWRHKHFKKQTQGIGADSWQIYSADGAFVTPLLVDNATYYTNSENARLPEVSWCAAPLYKCVLPQSNGQAEAAVKILLNSLQRAVGNHPDRWDKKLPWTLLGVRNAKHSTTGYSPFFVMTGRHAVLPAERRAQVGTAGPSSSQANPATAQPTTQQPHMLATSSAAATADTHLNEPPFKTHPNPRQQETRTPLPPLRCRTG